MVWGCVSDSVVKMELTYLEDNVVSQHFCLWFTAQQVVNQTFTAREISRVYINLALCVLIYFINTSSNGPKSPIYPFGLSLQHQILQT